MSEDIEMAPADTPNGDYAILNENDEIELLLTDANPYIDGAGVDADAVTPIDCVFTVTYTGDSQAEVWLTDDAEDVRFYRDTDPEDSLERSENSVVLHPNETVTVGLLVDTRGDHDVEDVDTFTVHAELAEQRDQRNSGNSRNEAAVEANEPVRQTSEPTATPEPQEGASTETTARPPTATADQTPSVDADGESTETASDRTDTAATDEDDTASADETPTADEPTELGGFSPGPLGLVGGSLAAVLLGLAAFRAFG